VQSIFCSLRFRFIAGFTVTISIKVDNKMRFYPLSVILQSDGSGFFAESLDDCMQETVCQKRFWEEPL
jgi:hypothetical protein